MRQAIAHFEKQKGDPDATGAYTVLSRALLMEGRLDEARHALEQAAELSKSTPDPALRLRLEIQKAAVELAGTSKSGAAAAGHELRSAISTAKKLGYYDLECEGRLALGEIETNSKSAEGRAQLTRLAAEARRQGLELLAQKTERALARPNLMAATTSKP